MAGWVRWPYLWSGAIRRGGGIYEVDWGVTPTRFRESLAALHWSQRGLAAVLQCDDRIIRRWSSGEAEIPASVAAWLETLARCHESVPPPQGWKRRAHTER